MNTTDQYRRSFLDILLSWRNTLIRNMFLVVIAGVVIVILLPKWYQADVVFIPRTGQSGFNFGGLGLGMLTGSSTSMFMPELDENELKVLLYSRRLLDAYNEEFSIQKFYKIRKREEFYHACKELITYDLDEVSGLGTSDILAYHIKVIDKRSDQVAAIADFLVAKMGEMVKKIDQDREREALEIIAKIRQKKHVKLDSLEAQIRVLVNEEGLAPDEFMLPLYSQYPIQELATEMFQLEVRREVLKKLVAPDHYELKKLDTQIAILQRKYQDFLGGTASDDITLPRMFNTGFDYMKLKADYLVTTEVLKQLEEQIVLAEAKLTDMVNPIRIVDQAFEPEKRIKPKRKILLILIFLGALIVHVAVIYLVELYQRADNDNRSKIRQLFRLKQ